LARCCAISVVIFPTLDNIFLTAKENCHHAWGRMNESTRFWQKQLARFLCWYNFIKIINNILYIQMVKAYKPSYGQIIPYGQIIHPWSKLMRRPSHIYDQMSGFNNAVRPQFTNMTGCANSVFINQDVCKSKCL
jgi:hypothetical protein